MSSFSERDVRRHYDLLQHKPELGLTQLKAMDRDQIIGIGLFENEEDFASECLRYNGLGDLYVGVNPRTHRLLEDYGGLRNRMRTLFTDVVAAGDIDYVTGVAVTSSRDLAEGPREFAGDASVLSGREILLPLDEPIPAPKESYSDLQRQVARWAYGDEEAGGFSLMQSVRVMGTARVGGSWLRRRGKFRNYRPYILDGISARVSGKDSDEGERGGGAG